MDPVCGGSYIILSIDSIERIFKTLRIGKILWGVLSIRRIIPWDTLKVTGWGIKKLDLELFLKSKELHVFPEDR